MTVNNTAEATDEVDTSTNEETSNPEAELENSDFSFDSEDDTDETDESEEVEESEETDDDEEATESTDETKEESAEDEDLKTEEADTTSEEQQRKAAKEAFDRREAARIAKEKAKQEAQDKYLNDAEDARDLAFRQLQVDAYNNRVLTNSNTLQNGIDKAIAHIDLFKTGTPEEKDELANALDDFERMYITRDQNGDPVEVRGDVFEFLATKAESIRRLTGVGARTAKQDKVKTKSRTLAPPTRAPKQKKSDPEIDGFDDEAARW